MKSIGNWLIPTEDGEECHASNFLGSFPGAPCGRCGHTNLVHGGPHNPSLGACALCLLVIAAARLAKTASPPLIPESPTHEPGTPWQAQERSP